MATGNSSFDADKLLYEHKLQKKRIWLDRALIGLLLVVATFSTALLVEMYKSDSTQIQFFLDKRLGAATEVRRALSEVTTPMFPLVDQVCHGHAYSTKDRDVTFASVSKLAHALNSSSILLDDAYQTEMHRGYVLLYAIAEDPCRAKCNATLFVSDISLYMTDVTRRKVLPKVSRFGRLTAWLLGNQVPQDVPASPFIPAGDSIREIDDMGAEGYFTKNFQAWATQKNVQIPATHACKAKP